MLTRRTLFAGIGAVALSNAGRASALSTPPALPEHAPAELGFSPALEAAADAVRDAVERQAVPGAILLIGRRDGIALHRAWGYSAVRPEKRPVAPDTLYDLASLTKCVATTAATAILVEAGKIGLDTPVADYVPPFGASGVADRARATVRHLLTHTAGLPAGGNYRNKTVSLAEIVRDIAASRRIAAPGEKFVYSDFSAITLQAIIEAVSGTTLDAFCAERVFGPLGMADTLYKPRGAMAARCAATTEENDSFDRLGIVHDPTARALGGVSGNAGLFSTASDLARYCALWLNEGAYGGVRIFKPETVREFTGGQAVTNGQRALGWDRDSPYSIRGSLPSGSYGHTGFTGTSLWLDPTTGTFIVLLTNAVHVPGASKVVIPLRRTVSSLVADALPELVKRTVTAEPRRVIIGLETLVGEGFNRLSGRKVGVVCNHTARDRQGRHIADLMHDSGKVNTVALFGPEHSIRGDVDASANDSKDERTGLPVYSLYNLNLPREQRYRPTAEQLAGIDTLIYDIQDIGARYYTYIATLGYCMEEAAKRNIRVVVLDRPNPLGGELVEGPLLDADLAGGFTTYHTMPITHGMTVGELARLFNAEKIGAELEVVSLTGWTRGLRYDQTGLPWVNPSPNMRSVRAAWLYPGVGLLEVLPLSVGRGTDTPFEIFGAPFIDPIALADDLNSRNLRGISFVPVRFTPNSSVHKGKECGGVQVNLWDRDACPPSALGIHLIDSLARLFPNDLTADALKRLRGAIGAQRVVDQLIAHRPPADIVAAWSADVADWKRRRAPFLLYR